MALAPLSSIWATTIHVVALAIGGGATAMEAATEEDEVLHMSRANKVAFAETTGTAFLRTRALCPPARYQLAKLFPTVQEFRAHCPD